MQTPPRDLGASSRTTSRLRARSTIVLFGALVVLLLPALEHCRRRQSDVSIHL